MTHDPENPTPRDIRLKRLYYRSMHRGCKETDLVLGQFAQAHLEALSPETLDCYEAFIEEHDGDIWHWLTGNTAPPADGRYDALLEQLRRHAPA